MGVWVRVIADIGLYRDITGPSLSRHCRKQDIPQGLPQSRNLMENMENDIKTGVKCCIGFQGFPKVGIAFRGPSGED